MHGSILPCLNVQAGGGGVMMWGIFSWNTLRPLGPIEHRLNATAYLSIVADHVHPFMTSVPIFWCYFQQDNAPCHKAQIISDWFLEHDNEFTLLHFTQMTSTVTRSQSNRAPLGCGGTGDSHHGCAADKSAATVWWYHVNMDQIFFQNLDESMLWRIKAVLKAKGVQPCTSKVYLIKLPVASAVIKTDFSVSLLQSTVTHDPSEINLIMLICCLRNISYYYYQCWKQLCYLMLLWMIDILSAFFAKYKVQHLFDTEIFFVTL